MDDNLCEDPCNNDAYGHQEENLNRQRLLVLVEFLSVDDKLINHCKDLDVHNYYQVFELLISFGGENLNSSSQSLWSIDVKLSVTDEVLDSLKHMDYCLLNPRLKKLAFFADYCLIAGVVRYGDSFEYAPVSQKKALYLRV